MKPMRLLLVDDHEIVRTGLKAVLQPHTEFEIIGEAANGKDAIEKSKSLKPDVVLLDISMPVMNGLEATRHIVKSSPETQVLILTVHDSQSIANDALHAGARGYVLKSDAGRELLRALRLLRENKTYFSRNIAKESKGSHNGDGTEDPKEGVTA